MSQDLVDDDVWRESDIRFGPHSVQQSDADIGEATK